MIVYAVPKGALEFTRIPWHNFTPTTREDREHHLWFTNLYDCILLCAFYIYLRRLKMSTNVKIKPTQKVSRLMF